MKKYVSTQKTLAVLLSGKSPAAKKFAGKHVIIIKDIIVPLKKGEDGWKDFMKLEKKWGQSPVITFVPRQDISYIL
jgi:hypothetical protein